MIRHSKRFSLFVFGALALSLPGAAAAQPYIYPNQGQMPQQQESDKGQCYSWAVQQTGFDPSNPQVAQAAPPPMDPGQPQAPCGSGSWGGRCPSMDDYVTGTGATRGATAAGGR